MKYIPIGLSGEIARKMSEIRVRHPFPMNPESASKHSKVSFTRLDKRDELALIRQNRAILESSLFLLDARKREVVVRDGSPVDMKIRSSRPGDVVPLGVKKVDDVLYRFYFVSDDLLQILQPDA